jgi:hypothetical protein
LKEHVAEEFSRGLDEEEDEPAGLPGCGSGKSLSAPASSLPDLPGAVMQASAPRRGWMHWLLARSREAAPWAIGGGIVGALLGLLFVALHFTIGLGHADYAVAKLVERKSFGELVRMAVFRWSTLGWVASGAALGLLALMNLWRERRGTGILLALACPLVAASYPAVLALRLVVAQQHLVSGPVSEVLVTALVGASCGPLVRLYLKAHDSVLEQVDAPEDAYLLERKEPGDAATEAPGSGDAR